MKKFENLKFTDHYMFEKVLQNHEICKELLERLLKIKIDHLEYPEIEKTISPYYETRGVRLDVYLKDSDKIFDIELQNSIDIDLPLRTRFYQSMVDTDNLLKGQHYSELPQSYVIFICNYDPFNSDLPIYTFRNYCEENKNLLLQDKSIKKFYNALAYEKENDIEIRAFLQYTCKEETADEFTNRIASLIHTIKQQEVSRKEYQTMNIHDQDTFRRGKKEGAEQKAIETAKKLLEIGMPIEQVANITVLSEEVVNALFNEQNK